MVTPLVASYDSNLDPWILPLVAKVRKVARAGSMGSLEGPRRHARGPCDSSKRREQSRSVRHQRPGFSKLTRRAREDRAPGRSRASGNNAKGIVPGRSVLFEGQPEGIELG